MKVSEIIKTTAQNLRIELNEIFFEEDTTDYTVDRQALEFELNNNKTMKLLVDCLNYVLDDLASDYAPKIERGKLHCNEGFASFATLESSLLEILKLTDSTGKNVRYRYVPNGLFCDVDGVLDVIFTTRYPVVGYFDEIDVSNAKIDSRVISYGVAAEYCLLVGDYENMTVWDNRYKNCIASATVKKSEKTLPTRRWY